MTTKTLDNIKACVFDAYGTLFDFNSAAERSRDVLGDKVDELSAVWRTKQLQYTWLRGLMGKHAPFWQVTGEALDYALDTLGIEDPVLRQRLMDLYLRIEAFPEVVDVLKALKDGGMKTAILSNGSPDMLAAAVENTGTGPYLDAVLSVEDVGVFKPHFSVYQLACDRLGVAAGEISFQSSNSWDAVGAATFGMRVVWINRYGQRRERLTADPDIEVSSMTDLPAIVGVA